MMRFFFFFFSRLVHLVFMSRVTAKAMLGECKRARERGVYALTRRTVFSIGVDRTVVSVRGRQCQLKLL